PVLMSGLEVLVKRPELVTTTVADNLHVTRTKTTQIKKAYNDASFRFEYRDKKVTSPNLKTAQLTNTLKDAITPINSYKKLLDARVKWPLGIRKPPKENFLTAMAYPDIPEPSYKYLLDIDEEFLLPNLRLIPPNTLSLLRTNQKFIEAYLMGLNHEMGRELLWREFPTDMRGSYFRQFWDVAGFVTPDTTPKDAENLKDIEPIHTWPGNSRLGRHNKRDKEGDSEQLVFVIKGDLLRNFPNTVIYAQKALKDGSERKIRVEMTEAQFKKEVRFPLYQAEIKPEIKLLGFDLTIEEASAEVHTPGFTDKQGWFFVIAEVPGEPHFGMDVSYNPNQPATFSWNDLSWQNFDEHMKFVRSDVIPGNATSGAVFIPPNDSKAGIWGKSSADMASILFQRPVMVAIHATEMLDVDIPTRGFATPLTMTTLRSFVRSNVNV
ncbi:MAG: hypothetical protein LC662_06445, partial [Rhodothermaceae bacterium]|nr:hypothetical protein [Rhodothermaceae bacterium]